MPIKLFPSLSGNPEWGDIAGSINFQTDLAAILSDKSPQSHNHNLSELFEKSYNSLDDLPDISNFINLDSMPQPAPCYTFDGSDDYLEISHRTIIDVSENFSIILRCSVDEMDEFRVLAAKGIRSSNTGWTIFCDYGTLGFSIGDGSKYLTATHSRLLSEGEIYQIAVSYNHDVRTLILCINNEVESFDFTILNTPQGNISPLIVGKNPANSDFSKLSVVSLIYINDSLSNSELLRNYGNGNMPNYELSIMKTDIALALLPTNFGRYYWYDSSLQENHGKINGGMQACFNTEKVIIPLKNTNGDLSLSGAITAGYSVDYIYCNNHNLADLSISVGIGIDSVITSETISGDSEKIIPVNRMFSMNFDNSLDVNFDDTPVDCDIIVFLSKQL
ncbi:MAG: hypothetical protein KIT33_08695 [Candidatus Kapabacteria bacterium]|nr:hypothetical protein [Ignavibacteriota bacterium]MCW5885033.1 hypothetical protein [Candidatus Kapabacteria bacterium]